MPFSLLAVRFSSVNNLQAYMLLKVNRQEWVGTDLRVSPASGQALPRGPPKTRLCPQNTLPAIMSRPSPSRCRWLSSTIQSKKKAQPQNLKSHQSPLWKAHHYPKKSYIKPVFCSVLCFCSGEIFLPSQ